MIQIELTGIAKRFARTWVLQDLSETFSAGEVVGIKGRNGSGKSTLLRILCGQLTPSRGKVDFKVNEKSLADDERYQHVSWTGPYLEIPEELTISEFLEFHFRFKPLRSGLSLAELPDLLELAHARNRRLTDCSSGMRQRVLLGSALYAATPLLLLDEPTVTLDEDAISWFHQQLSTSIEGRLTIIASNDKEDLRGCTRILSL